MSKLELESELLPEIQRASRAAAFVNDPLFKEAVEHIRKSLYERFCATRIDDAPARERLHQMLFAVGEFEDFFQQVISTGDIAMERLQEAEDEDAAERELDLTARLLNGAATRKGA